MSLNTLRELPSLAKWRRLMELAHVETSKTERADPRCTRPKIEIELPIRKKLRQEKADAQFTKSNTEQEDPKRADPKTE
jgi:hypothetical protein